MYPKSWPRRPRPRRAGSTSPEEIHAVMVEPPIPRWRATALAVQDVLGPIEKYMTDRSMYGTLAITSGGDDTQDRREVTPKCHGPKLLE